MSPGVSVSSGGSSREGWIVAGCTVIESREGCRGRGGEGGGEGSGGGVDLVTHRGRYRDARSRPPPT